jgi:hypothetical protein
MLLAVTGLLSVAPVTKFCVPTPTAETTYGTPPHLLLSRIAQQCTQFGRRHPRSAWDSFLLPLCSCQSGWQWAGAKSQAMLRNTEGSRKHTWTGWRRIKRCGRVLGAYDRTPLTDCPRCWKTAHQKAEGTKEDRWREFWMCETGRGQEVAQLRGSYMPMTN